MAEQDASSSGGQSRPRFAFFSGKGGVGKTTLAAATAVRLARSGQRVLITSTDPAHSLSDVFAREIGDAGCELAPGLLGLELDSSARWNAAAGAFEAGAAEARGRRGRLQRALGDAMQALGDAPGVDEFMSLELLLETMSTDAFDWVVFDTAPTGHTLRLLSLPQMLDGWVGRLLSLRSALGKMGRAFRRLLPGTGGEQAEMDEQLGSIRERVRLARELLADPARSLFCLVTIPEAMGVLETERTLAQLRQHDIPVARIVANQVQPQSVHCQHCQRRHAIHRGELERLEVVAAGLPVDTIAAEPHVVRGVEALAALGAELWPQGAGTGPCSDRDAG